MAGQVNIKRVVKQLKENISEPQFTEIYKQLNLKDDDFLVAVRHCTDMNYRKVFGMLIKAEYLNFPLVTKAFKTVIHFGHDKWIVSVIKEIEPLPHDGGSKMCLCSCVAEILVSDSDGLGFKLLTEIAFMCNRNKYFALSCILQHFLIDSPADDRGKIRLGYLEKWFCNKSAVGDLLARMHLACLHFKNKVSSDEMSRKVQLCLNQKLYCVAMYMCFLHQDYQRMAQVITQYHSDIGESLTFIMRLGLHPVIMKHTLNVIESLFGLYEERGDVGKLFDIFCFYYTRKLNKRMMQPLFESCQKKGHLMCYVNMLGWSHDWEGVIRQTRTCGNPGLVDCAIKALCKYQSPGIFILELLDLSSKTPDIMAIGVITATNCFVINRLIALLEGDKEIDTIFIFHHWSASGVFLVTSDSLVPDKEDILTELFQILIDSGLLYQFCFWFEQMEMHRLRDNRRYKRSLLGYFDKALDKNLHRLLRLVLSNGCVPAMCVYQTVHNTQRMKLLETKSKECVPLLLSYSSNCRSLQNIVTSIISREINVFPWYRHRRRSTYRVINS